MLHLTICTSVDSAFKAECEAIAAALRSSEVDVRVYEQDVTYRVDSDFWLVTADELDHQLAAAKTDSRIDPARFVVLRAPAGKSLEIAERVQPAAVVYAPDPARWQTSSRGGLIVRSELGEQLGGELGRVSRSEHYASWWRGPDHTLAQQLVAYLVAFASRGQRDVTLVRAEDAGQRGLPAVTVAADVRGGGMFATPFAGDHVLVTMSGPPGGVATIAVIAAKPATGAGELVEVAQASVGAWLGGAFEVGVVEAAQLAGDQRPCVILYSGGGFRRAAWLCCPVSVAGGTVVVVAGVSARSDRPMTAADIIHNPAIGKTLATLEIR